MKLTSFGQKRTREMKDELYGGYKKRDAEGKEKRSSNSDVTSQAQPVSSSALSLRPAPGSRLQTT